MTRFLSRLFLAGLLAGFAAPALAQTANLQITANVNPTCRVSSAAPAITMAYDIFAPATTSSGNFAVQVRCTKNTTISVAASAGAHAAVAPAGFARAVVAGPEVIGYTLSLTAGGAELAPGVASGSYASAGKGTDVPVTLYAQLDTAGSSDPAPGSYTDTVLLTFTAL